MTNEVSLDFESRSAVELGDSGVYPYADHETTDVWCAAFYVPELDDVLLWTPDDRYDVEYILRELAKNPDVTFRAWNAQFERIMWEAQMRKRRKFPEIDLSRWRCTAAEAAACGLPRKLDNTARVLKVQEQKDMAGHRLMMQMAKPRKPRKTEDPDALLWWDDEERKDRLFGYCKQDVRTEMSVKKRVRDLPPAELAVYQLDQRINDRGVLLDRPLAVAISKMADKVRGDADKEMQRITAGAVDKVSNTAALRQFANDHGVPTDSVAKEAIRVMLEDPHVTDKVRAALQLRADAGQSSLAKVDAMFNVAHPADDRMRGLLLYHGAGTGRWAGKLVQPQNFPARSKALGGKFKPEVWRELVMRHAWDYIALSYAPLEVLAQMLRACLRASPGCEFHSADYTAIEARVGAWLAGEEWQLAAFRANDADKSNADAYMLMAADIYRLPIATIQAAGKGSPWRDMGKRVTLGCLFGMGHVKFADTLLKDGIVIELHESKRIVDLYRERNANIVAVWREIERAAVAAVNEPGKIFYAASGRLAFMVRDDYLRIALPSKKRTLAYFKPHLVERRTPWGTMQKSVRFWGEVGPARQWLPVDLYGGLIFENVVQATARDIMAGGMFVAEAHGYSVILSVHDELLTEAPIGRGNFKELEQLMAQTEPWAVGCPIAAEGWTGPAYRK